MNILISGASVAGLTIAYWLKRFGFNPTLVERAPRLSTGGYKLDVRGEALKVLSRMGIEETVIEQSTDMQGAKLVDKHGKVLQEMSGDQFGHRQGDDVEILRGRLCQILRAKIPDVEIIFDDKITEIKQDENQVTVKFETHEPRQFDLVIGADGIHSNVRRLAFGDESQFLKDLGLYLCVYTAPNYLNLDRMEMQYSEIGRIAAVWSSKDEDTLKATFGFTSPTSINLHSKEEQQQAVKAIYKDVQWEVPKLLELMDQADDFYFDIAAQIHMNTWSEGRVVLVGDAGYCASPMSGQGTSLALIGAYVLAGELHQANGDYNSAFQNYETVLCPFVKANQLLGIKASELMHSNEKKSFFAWMLNKLIHFAPGRLIEYFINRSTRRIAHAAQSIKLKNY